MIVQRTFPRDVESVPTVRRFVTEAVTGVSRETIDSVTLLVSELATNAIVHADTDFVVRVEWTKRQVCVEVSDTGAGIPALRHSRPYDTSGRGLPIVDALSDSWGVRPSAAGRGKTVWFIVSNGRKTIGL